MQLSLFVIAMPQKDGIIHCHGKLQHSAERFCNVRNFSEKVVCSEVEHDHHADGRQKHKRDQPAVQKRDHRHAGAQHRKPDINRLFLFAKILQIRHKRGHAANKALLPCNGADLSNGIHGGVRRGGAVEKHGDHRRMVRIERIIDFLRQKLHWDHPVAQGRKPQNRIHMLHGFELVAQVCNLILRHILYDHE